MPDREADVVRIPRAIEEGDSVSYERQVEAAAAALLKGEDANWELARLTYQNTNRKGQRNAGGVSHARWSADVRSASGRRFSETTSTKYASMWERFGDDRTNVQSWTDAWYELTPRDSGEAMRGRAAETHITKEATPERKRELLQLLLDDPDVRNNIEVQRSIRALIHDTDRGLRRPPTARPSDNPEEWDEAQWQAFDGKVIQAAGTVATALNLWHRGTYTPSIGAAALLTLFKQHDLDAELADLLEQQS